MTMIRLSPFARGNRKILLVVLLGCGLLLWQLSVWILTPPTPNYVDLLPLFPKLKKPIGQRVLKKEASVFYSNITPVVISEDQTPAEVEERFYRYLESKEVRCPNMKRLGNPHEGGWDVCLSPPYGLYKPCLVFSFGINNDWQFDEAVSIIYKCKVLAFDPSMNMKSHDRDENIHFEPTALGGKNEINQNGWKMITFQTYLQERHLEDTVIDYLKFDIEYSEWAVLETMATDGSLRNVKQLGFEIHTSELFKAFKIDIPTYKGDYLKMYRLLRTLEKQGFKRYDHRRNPFGDFNSKISGKSQPCCYELYYLNMRFLDS